MPTAYKAAMRDYKELDGLVQRSPNIDGCRMPWRRPGETRRATDAELREMAQEEVARLTEKRCSCPRLQEAWCRTTPVMPGIACWRSGHGTGGDEAARVGGRPVPDVRPLLRGPKSGGRWTGR